VALRCSPQLQLDELGILNLPPTHSMSEYFTGLVKDEHGIPASKRRRVNATHTAVVVENTGNESKPLERLIPILSKLATEEEIGQETMVCYGMVRRVLLRYGIYAYMADTRSGSTCWIS